MMTEVLKGYGGFCTSAQVKKRYKNKTCQTLRNTQDPYPPINSIIRHLNTSTGKICLTRGRKLPGDHSRFVRNSESKIVHEKLTKRRKTPKREC